MSNWLLSDHNNKIKNTELTLNPVFSIYTKYFIVPFLERLFYFIIILKLKFFQFIFKFHCYLFVSFFSE